MTEIIIPKEDETSHGRETQKNGQRINRKIKRTNGVHAVTNFIRVTCIDAN